MLSTRGTSWRHGAYAILYMLPLCLSSRELRSAFGLLSFALACRAAASDLIYREGFTNTSPPANQTASAAGWTAYSGAEADDLSNVVPLAGENHVGLSFANGTGNPAIPGYLFSAAVANSANVFVAFETFAPAMLESVTWKMGNTDSGTVVRLLVQQNGSWYASDSAYSTSEFANAALFQAAPETKTFVFSPSAAHWRPLSLAPGRALSLGGSPLAADLASATITGLGFYISHRATPASAATRIDDLIARGSSLPSPSVPSSYGSRLMNNLQAGRRQTIVTYGTSLTAAGEWVTAMGAWLNGLFPGQVTIVNGGMGGRASNTGISNLQRSVIAKTPDAVFLEFAINDANTAYAENDPDRGITVEKSKANLSRMIDAIQLARPGAEIFVQTMNPAWDPPSGNRAGSKRAELAAYYEGYRRVAASRGVTLIDHFGNWTRIQATDPARFQALLPDGIHPTSTASTTVTLPEIQRVLLSR